MGAGGRGGDGGEYMGWKYRGTILVGGYMGGVKIWRLEVNIWYGVKIWMSRYGGEAMRVEMWVGEILEMKIWVGEDIGVEIWG